MAFISGLQSSIPLDSNPAAVLYVKQDFIDKNPTYGTGWD
jgi:hypothetical protein